MTADDRSVNTDFSGGTRFSSGKPGGWWYAPLYGLRLVAEVWQLGAMKYAPMDWACGQQFSTLMDSMSRHWIALMTEGPYARDALEIDGEVRPGRGPLHAAALAWNVLCLLHFIAQGRTDLDDVSGWRGVNAFTKRTMGYTFVAAPPPTLPVEEKTSDANPNPEDSAAAPEKTQS